jgi:hypothetical protein
MKVMCLECGKKFEDDYKDLAELNLRRFCNLCREERWKKRIKWEKKE